MAGPPKNNSATYGKPDRVAQGLAFGLDFGAMGSVIAIAPGPPGSSR